jgi:hypothetical protein
MGAAEAPSLSPLSDGYLLQSRADRPDGPRPLTARNGPAVEDRLRQTSLYRPDLDVAVVTEADECAVYALSWYDSVTRVGLIEPMRTENDHRRRGGDRQRGWYVSSTMPLGYGSARMSLIR